MSHGLQSDPADLVEPRLAATVAETLQALTAPSRLRILGRLSKGPCSVGDLSTAVNMEPSAVSHQLRLLRHLGLVTGQRDGRRVVYELHDEHVSQLLGEAMSHVDHLRLGLAGRRERSALKAAAG
jgi:ArsR family transcriptional regulator, nickel/cobalt-responsive transcriptional repressor